MHGDIPNNVASGGPYEVGSYDRFLSNKLEYYYTQEKIEEAIAELPVVE